MGVLLELGAPTNIPRIHNTDGMCVEVHNTLQRIAQDQGLIPPGQHIQAQSGARGSRSQEKGLQDKIQE
eukprot:11594351-Prorocentrum_lima.AAC.1